MSTLQEKIREIASKAKKYEIEGVNESGTKRGLIDPLLMQIGWDISDFHVVHPEYPVQLEGDNNPADYALKIDGNPRIFVEAKRINLDIKEAIIDGTKKCLQENVPWLVATNGDKIELLKIQEEIPEAERTVFQIVLTNTSGQQVIEAVRLLNLLSPERVSSGELEEFATANLKRKRAVNSIREYLKSGNFIEAVQDTHKNLYAGDEADLDMIRDLLNEIAVTSQRKPLEESTQITHRDKEIEIVKRREKLFRVRSKRDEQNIKKYIIDKKELWIDLIEKKEMLSADFQELSPELEGKKVSAFTTFCSVNGLLTKGTRNPHLKCHSWIITEEAIPGISRILNI